MDLQTADLGKRLAERRIALELSAEARHFIAREAFDPVFGARPLKRYLQHQLETRLGRAIIAGEVGDGATVRVGLEGGELAITIEAPPAVGETATGAEEGEEPEAVEAEIVDVGA